MRRILMAAIAMAFVPVVPRAVAADIHQDKHEVKHDTKSVTQDKEAYARAQQKLSEDHGKTVKDYYALGYAKRDAAVADAARKRFEQAAQAYAAKGDHATAESYRRQAEEQRHKFAEAQRKIPESQHAYDEDLRREQADKDRMTRSYNNAVTDQRQLNVDQQTLNRAEAERASGK